MTKAFVVSACGTVDEHAIERLQVNGDQEALLRSEEFCGGSSVVAPDSSIVAGPLGREEDILYADLDLEIGVRMKLRHDFAGHYNRPDVFQLRVHLATTDLLDVSPSPTLGHRGTGTETPALEDRRGVLPPLADDSAAPVSTETVARQEPRAGTPG